MLIAALAGTDAPVSADPKEEELIRTTTFADLQDTIKQHKGKVVLIDFWAEFCVPCKKAFPHLVKLHNKLGKDGLVVLSVNVDDPNDKDAQKGARAFFKKQKASFPCLFFKSAKELEKTSKHYDVDSIPHVVIYDRQGKVAEEDADVDELEEAVQKLLKKK